MSKIPIVIAIILTVSLALVNIGMHIEWNIFNIGIMILLDVLFLTICWGVAIGIYQEIKNNEQ